VIVKTGADAKGAPKYGFYRVTGTDQQILDGIRSIRGKGTGDVYDDMIRSLEGQISDNRAELNRLQSTAEDFADALQEAGTNTDKRGRIGRELQSVRSEIQRTNNRIGELERSIVDFRDQKAKSVKAIDAGAY
jgi:chromosome segregation ATPase